jgi:hypothetical protein
MVNYTNYITDVFIAAEKDTRKRKLIIFITNQWSVAFSHVARCAKYVYFLTYLTTLFQLHNVRGVKWNTDFERWSGKHQKVIVSYTGPLSQYLRKGTKKKAKIIGQLASRLGRAIAQAVSRRLPTAAAWIRAQVRSYGICGGQSSTGAGFLRVLRFPLPILIPLTAPHSSSSTIRGWYNRPISGRRTKWTQCHTTPRMRVE